MPSVMNYALSIIALILIAITLFFIYKFVSSKYIKSRFGKKTHLKILEPNHNKNTIIGLLEWASREYPDKPALKFKTMTCKNWKTINYIEYYDSVTRFAKCVRSRIPYDTKLCVGIIGYNSPEWFYSHIGTMMASGVSIGMYPTCDYNTCQQIVNQANINVLVVEDTEQLEKFSKMDENIKTKIKLIIYYGNVKNDAKEKFNNVEIINYIDFIRDTRDTGDFELNNTVASDDPATIIFTSGTTGDAKGVIIKHSNITDILNNMIFTINMKSDLDICIGERYISYLPLNHIAAQLMDIYVPIASLGTVYFSDNDAMKGSLIKTIKDVKPTIFIGVPRVWEKMMEQLQEKSINDSYISGILSPMVLSKIGLDQCRFPITGSAPISDDVVNFFEKHGLYLCNIYGLSETTGPISLTLPGRRKSGSVGIPLIETKISDSSEILVKGLSVFSGYYENQEKTKESFTEDGWFKTGDLGKIDSDGYLYITGRLKDIIITSGGENISPIPIENKFMAQLDELFDNVVLIGDKRKFLSILIVPKFTRNKISPCIKKYRKPSLNTNRYLKKLIEKVRINVNSSSPSRAQNIQKWIILDNPFSINEELTPTLKLRRDYINKKYKKIIDKLYD